MTAAVDALTCPRPVFPETIALPRWAESPSADPLCEKLQGRMSQVRRPHNDLAETGSFQDDLRLVLRLLNELRQDRFTFSPQAFDGRTMVERTTWGSTLS
jgi:hypothetical protein